MAHMTINELDPDGTIVQDMAGFPVFLADGGKFFVDEDLRDSDGDVRDDVYRERCNNGCGQAFLASPQAGGFDYCPLCEERLGYLAN